MYSRALTLHRRGLLCLMSLPVCLGWGCRRAAVEQEAPGMSRRLASASLVDQDGRALNVADFAGNLLVLSFIFTSCASVCPRETRALAAVQKRLPVEVRRRVRFLSLSVDPENDSPAALKKFALANQASLDGWSFVRAAPADTRAVMVEMAAFDPRVDGATTPAGHTTAVYLFDGSGHLKQRYAGSPLDEARLAREIEQLDSWARTKREAS